MKICIFSDIHGNVEALRLMLKQEKENVDFYLFLGDVFGYFYNPVEVIETLMNISNLYSIKGNHDDLYIKGLSDSNIREKCIDAYGKSYSLDISLEQQKYITTLPEFIKINIAGKRIGAYHGGPLDYLNERVYPDSHISLKKDDRELDYLFLGHTHYRFDKPIGQTTIINPGSLGQPRDGKGFSYCVLDCDNDYFEFKNVNIDIKQLLLQVKLKDYGTKNYQYLEKKYGVQNE